MTPCSIGGWIGTLLLVLSLALLMGSCASIERKREAPGKSAPPRSRERATPSATLAVQRAVIISPNKEVTTTSDMVIQVFSATAKGTHDYSVMFGPWPSGTGSGMVLNPEPVWQVHTGYAYFWGIWPSGRSRRVSTAAQAATHIVYIQSDQVDRVIYLSPTPPITAPHEVTVTLAPGRAAAPGHPTELTMTAASYVEATDGPGGTVILSGPHQLPDDTTHDIWLLIHAVESKAAAAGF